MVYYKKYNPLVIFYCAEEYRDDVIADYILWYTFLEEYICLIE
jgi:hypothetical protein